MQKSRPKIVQYLISIGLFVLLMGELVLFVKIIGKYRKRFVPLGTLFAILLVNFALSYALLYVPHKVAPAATAPAVSAP